MDLPMAPSLPDVPPWQQHGAAQAQAAAEGGSSIIDEDGNVGFAVPAQVQVGKPESSWRCVGSLSPLLRLAVAAAAVGLSGLQGSGWAERAC